MRTGKHRRTMHVHHGCFIFGIVSLKAIPIEWQTIRKYPNYLPLILVDSIKMLFEMDLIPFSQVLEPYSLYSVHKWERVGSMSVCASV